MKANVILIGPPGTGKSWALRTLARKKRTFVLSTEPGFEHTIRGKKGKQWRKEDQEDLHGFMHMSYIPPANASWDTMIDNAQKINTLNNDILQKMQGMHKSDYAQFIELLNQCANFKCSICGEEFGDVSEWDDSRALALDGLSGTSVMAMDLVVGSKPIKTQPDWGVAMDNLERLITKLCVDTKCSFVLISHLEREHDEITGGTQLTISTLGRKLAPKIPRFFDEVILSVRDGKDFKWSTSAINVDLKTRLLPITDELEPDFAQMFVSETD